MGGPVAEWRPVAAIGDDCEVHPFVSIGGPPQDLKYRGEETRLTIGARNIFRESATINRGTVGGGGLTTIGDDNLFMAGRCMSATHEALGSARVIGTCLATGEAVGKAAARMAERG